MDNAEEKRGRFGWLGTPAARVWLWIAIILLGGLSAIYAHLHPYFRQRAAVRAIEAAGGGVQLEPIEFNENNFLVSSWREALEYLFGDEEHVFVSQAEEAAIYTDESMRALGGLINLKYLTLDESLDERKITDAALDYMYLCPHLEGINITTENITKTGLKRLDTKLLPQLKTVELQSTYIDDDLLEHYVQNGIIRRLQCLHVFMGGITDKGLEYLKMSPKLAVLEIQGNSITDAGLVHITDMRKLMILSLASTKITDAGVMHLAGLQFLIHLDLNYTNLSNAGMEHLQGLENLEWLQLDDTKITDVGLAHLKRLGKLQSLDVEKTKITDAGLDILTEMKSLRSVCVRKTKVTREGVEKFHKARPDCNIMSDY